MTPVGIVTLGWSLIAGAVFAAAFVMVVFL